MKKLLWTLSLLTILISSASIPAFAAGGKAVVPPFDSSLVSATLYYQD
jgi:hypothetical protein